MTIKSDRWIKRMALEHKMIEPFVESQTRTGVVSYGVSSYGYDIRVADDFKVFTNIYNTVVDPKSFDPRSFVDIKADAADPAAIARLERAQSEFNRSAAARAEFALRQEELDLRRRELEASRAPYDAGAPAPSSGYYSGYTGYPGYLYDYGVPYVTRPPRVTHHQSGDRRRPQGRVPAVIRLPQRG